jgi:hypothetical protein
MKFTTTHHDFGEIWDTESHPCEFTFTNAGGTTLSIRQVTSSCTCTNAVPDKWNYRPGEWGTIRTVFDPEEGGEDTKTIKLLTNMPTNPTVTLTVHSIVNEFVTFSERVLLFGEVERGMAHKKRFNMFVRGENVEIASIKSANEYLTAEVIQLNPQTGAATIEVTIAEDAPWGRMRMGKLDIDVRGRREDLKDVQKLAVMRVAGDVLDDIRADPLHVPLGLLRSGMNFRKEIKITSAAGAPFEVVGARVKNPEGADMNVTVEKVRDGFYDAFKLTLAGTTTAQEGMVLGLLEFETDDGDLRELAIIGKIGGRPVR